MYFTRMLPAVDVIQPDVTRCAGYTELLRIAAVANAAYVPLSPHCAPALHTPIATALRGLRHVEYFHDNVRIEHLLFDGVPEFNAGCLRPHDEPGNGLAFKAADAEAYRVS